MFFLPFIFSPRLSFFHSNGSACWELSRHILLQISIKSIQARSFAVSILWCLHPLTYVFTPRTWTKGRQQLTEFVCTTLIKISRQFRCFVTFLPREFSSNVVSGCNAFPNGLHTASCCVCVSGVRTYVRDLLTLDMDGPRFLCGN